MNDALAALTDLTPIAAIVIIAGVMATILTQLAKRPSWGPQRAQLLAIGISIVLGLAAYIVSGLTTVFPTTLVEAVSTAVIVIAGVAVASRVAYTLVGRAVPDGRETLTATPDTTGSYVVNVSGQPEQVTAALAEHGRRADRDGVMDGRDTPSDG